MHLKLQLTSDSWIQMLNQIIKSKAEFLLSFSCTPVCSSVFPNLKIWKFFPYHCSDNFNPQLLFMSFQIFNASAKTFKLPLKYVQNQTYPYSQPPLLQQLTQMPIITHQVCCVRLLSFCIHTAYFQCHS